MEDHKASLRRLCRLGGERLPSDRSSRKVTRYVAKEFADDIFTAHQVDVRGDDPDIHPPYFCAACMEALRRSVNTHTPTQHTTVSGGCGPLHEWSEHTDDECMVCVSMIKSAKGGRPAKRKRVTGPAMHSHHSSTDNASTVSTTVSVDMTIEDLRKTGTPPYRHVHNLSPSRFETHVSQLVCQICSMVVDEGLVAPCCHSTYCAACIHTHLTSSLSCPKCISHMQASQLQPFSPTLKAILGDLTVHCDFAQGPFEGCTVVTDLKNLSQHCTDCPFGSDSASAQSQERFGSSVTAKRTVTPSTKVSDVLDAPPSALQGNVSDALLSKLIECKAEDGVIHQRSGRKNITWVRASQANCPSGEVSARQSRRRASQIESFRQVVCGGAEGSRAQQVRDLKVMSHTNRDALLEEAGVLRKGIGEGIGLAIKADLQMPWNGLRKLRRYLREFGVPLESERTMREQLKTELPFPLVVREVPLHTDSNTIAMCPVAYFEDLVGLVKHYLTLNKEAGFLMWHDGLSESEVIVKVGGDHGGGSFKFCFQIVNVEHPNALSNTIPFLVFCAKDTPSNLAAMFSVYNTQLTALQNLTWEGKRVHLSFFGDYEFLTKSYGLSGSSGVRPCLFCLCTKTEIQKHIPTQSTTPRTLQQLTHDHTAFVAAGSVHTNAKLFNNVIRPAIVNIELDDVCVPVLHLDLGIFPWIFKAMQQDAEALDLLLARHCTDPTISSNAAISAIASKQLELEQKQQNLQAEEQQGAVAHTQLQWIVLQAENAEPGSAAYDQFTAIATLLHHQWSQHQQAAATVKSDIDKLEKDLQAANVRDGPCSASFEPVLKSHRIERQAYHSGAFIGNHIHKALQSTTTAEIVSAPLVTLHQQFNPDQSPMVFTQAQHQLLLKAEELRERYSELFMTYSKCRSVFAGTSKVTEHDLVALQEDVSTFMRLVRANIVTRQKKTITPKLHLLEHHTLPCMKRFGVALGLLGEQGGELVHHRFNTLKASLQNTAKDTDRLRVLVWQYLASTLPSHNKHILQPATRKKP